MKKLASAGMTLLEVLLISLQFGYQPVFGLEQFRGDRARPRKETQQSPVSDAVWQAM